MNTISVTNVRAYLSVAVLGIAALAAAPKAEGQAQGIQVKVPFSFEDGNRQLPAGVYTIRMETQHLMRVQGSSGGAFTTALPDESLKPATASKVVFNKYGDRYFLREVWVAGSTRHVHCLRSRSEKRLEVAYSGPGPKGEEVALLEMPR